MLTLEQLNNRMSELAKEELVTPSQLSAEDIEGEARYLTNFEEGEDLDSELRILLLSGHVIQDSAFTSPGEQVDFSIPRSEDIEEEPPEDETTEDDDTEELTETEETEETEEEVSA